MTALDSTNANFTEEITSLADVAHRSVEVLRSLGGSEGISDGAGKRGVTHSESCIGWKTGLAFVVAHPVRLVRRGVPFALPIRSGSRILRARPSSPSLRPE